MYTLYNWSFEVSSDGYLRCVGDLDNGREWQTSSVDRLITTHYGYRVVTQNSMYFLPW
jgi:hypothetical protein